MPAGSALGLRFPKEAGGAALEGLANWASRDVAAQLRGQQEPVRALAGVAAAHTRRSQFPGVHPQLCKSQQHDAVSLYIV